MESWPSLYVKTFSCNSCGGGGWVNLEGNTTSVVGVGPECIIKGGRERERTCE